MKNKILFIQLFLIVGLFNLSTKLKPMDLENEKNFVENVFNNDYFDGQLHIQECAKLIRKGDLEGLKKYFESNPVEINLGFLFDSDFQDDKEYMELLDPVDNNKTLLVFAVETENLPIIGFLVSKGADVNWVATDKDGEYNNKTLLMFAVDDGNILIVKYLLEQNADISLRDDNGKTALDYAKEYGHKEIVEILEQWPKNVSITVSKSTNLLSDISNVVAGYITDQEIRNIKLESYKKEEAEVNNKKRRRDDN